MGWLRGMGWGGVGSATPKPVHTLSDAAAPLRNTIWRLGLAAGAHAGGNDEEVLGMNGGDRGGAALVAADARGGWRGAGRRRQLLSISEAAKEERGC